MPKPLQKIRQSLSEIAAVRKSAISEKAFAKRLEPTLKIVARMRMEKMLQRAYPEMEFEKRKQISEKFAKKTGLMRNYATRKQIAAKGALLAAESSATLALFQDSNSLVNYAAGIAAITSVGVTAGLMKDDLMKKKDISGVHGNVNKFTNNVKIKQNDSKVMISAIDHEAVHFLNNELKLKHPKGTEELIATTIAASINEPYSYETIPVVEHLGIVKHLSEIPPSVRKEKSLIFWDKKFRDFKEMSYAFEKPSFIMSSVLEKQIGEDAKNKFIRMTMEGYNPIHSFNEIMSKNGKSALRALVQNGKVILRNKERDFDCS